MASTTKVVHSFLRSVYFGILGRSTKMLSPLSHRYICKLFAKVLPVGQPTVEIAIQGTSQADVTRWSPSPRFWSWFASGMCPEEPRSKEAGAGTKRHAANIVSVGLWLFRSALLSLMVRYCISCTHGSALESQRVRTAVFVSVGRNVHVLSFLVLTALPSRCAGSRWNRRGVGAGEVAGAVRVVQEMDSRNIHVILKQQESFFQKQKSPLK